jgi:hypothetical protein
VPQRQGLGPPTVTIWHYFHFHLYAWLGIPSHITRDPPLPTREATNSDVCIMISITPGKSLQIGMC